MPKSLLFYLMLLGVVGSMTTGLMSFKHTTSVCAITDITAETTQGACDPATNTYSQELIITYEDAPSSGTLNVNGQEFDITESPQSVTLTDLTADGNDVDVTASFSAVLNCSLSKSNLFTAASDCMPVCGISDLAAINQVPCDPSTGYYTQGVIVTYELPPSTGKLVVNGQEFDITTSPQLVTLVDLLADGSAVDVTASFSADTDCSLEELSLFTAPADCTPVCSISAVAAVGDQGDCVPETNTYTQDIEVTYENPPPSGGSLIVNGQNFEITESPQTVTLIDLVADGNDVDVVVSFENKPSCEVTETALFSAPADCTPLCDITSVVPVSHPKDCDDSASTYSIDLEVTYISAPATGNLTVNGQDFAIGTSPQVVTLTDLPTDGGEVDIFARFSDLTFCQFSGEKVFTALSDCSGTCAITDLQFKQQTACDDANSTYDMEVIVTYENPPADGDIVVNGQSFPIAFSPQIITLTDLAADGQTLDATASFSTDNACTLTVENFATAPSSCVGACEILGFTPTFRTECDPATNTFDQEVEITYTLAPSEGSLVVADQFFDITGSPQKVTLTGLEATGSFQNILVYFSEDNSCAKIFTNAFFSPDGCEAECEILALKALDREPCDSLTNTYTQFVEVRYSAAPDVGRLVVNGQDFPFETSPDTVELLGIVADGQPVDVTASFTANPDCSLTVEGLFTAASPCTKECSILDVVAVGQSECVPETNTYTQQLEVVYSAAPSSGSLVVNGESFAITSSPQTVTLADIPATGEAVDVSVSFSDDDACVFTKSNAFTTRPSCSTACEILDIITTGRAPECDPATDSYPQSFQVIFRNPPNSGQISLNGVAIDFTSSPADATLIMPADGQPVTMVAFFTADSSCSKTVTDLYTALESCRPPCVISNIEANGEPGLCDPADNTFLQDVTVTYEYPPLAAGSLVVNGQSFPIETSPQKVRLSLDSTGEPVDITASFSASSSCSFTVEDLVDAPLPCFTGCQVQGVASAGQSACENDLYSQTLAISFDNAPNTGNIIVNGQSFAVGASPQIVTLTNLTADGQAVDVMVSFSDNASCTFSASAVFTAPESCPVIEECAITGVSAGTQSACDPNTLTYTQDLIVTYSTPPSSGSLVVNGQNFAISSSPQTVTLANLAADGQSVNASVFFSDETSCNFAMDNVFTAPPSCAVECTISSITAGSQSACDPTSLTFTQDLIVTYVTPPSSGSLVVNGQSFAISGSPQTVTLVNLAANGQSVNASAFFSDATSCNFAMDDVFTAPPPCKACELNSITVGGGASNCDPETNTYSQDLIVTYDAPPSTGTLVVNTVEFSITGSPQTITLTDLPANGAAQSVTAFFSASPACSLTEISLFTAPSDCSCNPSVPRLNGTGETFCIAGTGEPSSILLAANQAPQGFTYNWYLNGELIADANSDTYTVNEGGDYTVVYQSITDPTCQSVSSNAFTVVAVSCACDAPEAPAIVASHTTICEAGTGTPNSTTFTASLAPSGYLYQWEMNGNTISGANDRNYTTSEAGVYNAYFVNAAADCRSISSNSISIIVQDCGTTNNCINTPLEIDLKADCNGAVTVYPNFLTAFSGTPPFRYFINDELAGSFGFEEIVEFSIPLGVGYVLRVVDDLGCEKVIDNSVAIPCITVPVELLDFSGEIVGDANHLYWHTASEIDADYFSILHSTDGLHFEAIGQVAAQGHSIAIKSYEFAHKQVSGGTHYYQLQLHNIDGSVESYRVISLVRSEQVLEWSYIRPLPVRNDLVLGINSHSNTPANIRLYGLDGQLVIQQQLDLHTGLNELVLDVAALASGIYILEVQTADGVLEYKVVKD